MVPPAKPIVPVVPLAPQIPALPDNPPKPTKPDRQHMLQLLQNVDEPKAPAVSLREHKTTAKEVELDDMQIIAEALVRQFRKTDLYAKVRDQFRKPVREQLSDAAALAKAIFATGDAQPAAKDQASSTVSLRKNEKVEGMLQSAELGVN